MDTAKNRGHTKLTAKLFEPMYKRFDSQLSSALLRRDAFLDRMIWQEIPHIREDLKGKKLSTNANRYISHSLKGLGGKETKPLKQVSIAVRHETAVALNNMVKDHNLVRDAVLNRLIALLRSSDKLLVALGLPNRVRWNRDDGTEDMPTSPLRAIEDTLCDPLYYLRAACKERHGCGLHLLAFPPEFMGLTCYLDDDQVPGTSTYKKSQEDDQLLRTVLDDFEANLTPINTQGA